MANDDLSAGDRWSRTVLEEFQRFRSLRPRPGRVFRHTPMPPEVRAAVTKSLGIWPMPPNKREDFVSMVAKKMAGLLGPWRHGVIPEPEASRAAAAAEAEGFAAASAYAAGKDLASEAERFEVVRRYGKDVWIRANRYAKSRDRAAGTSRAGPAALPPPAASVAVVSGPVQQLGLPSPSAPRAAATPEE